MRIIVNKKSDLEDFNFLNSFGSLPGILVWVRVFVKGLTVFIKDHDLEMKEKIQNQ